MKKWLALAVVFAMGFAVLCPAVVMADWKDPICEDPTMAEINPEAWKNAGCDRDDEDTFWKRVQGAIVAVFSVAGIIAVGFIMYGGVRYAISQGEPGKIKQAQDTILYAVIGLMVTLMAYAITIFVVNNMIVEGVSETTTVGEIIRPIATTVIFLAGLVTVVMIILGGWRYVSSQGDAGQLKQAKDTIMYGVIGLIVVLMAIAIVQFVLGGVFPTTPSD
jgi:hypothetical protein